MNIFNDEQSYQYKSHSGRQYQESECKQDSQEFYQFQEQLQLSQYLMQKDQDQIYTIDESNVLLICQKTQITEPVQIQMQQKLSQQENLRDKILNQNEQEQEQEETTEKNIKILKHSKITDCRKLLTIFLVSSLIISYMLFTFSIQYYSILMILLAFLVLYLNKGLFFLLIDISNSYLRLQQILQSTLSKYKGTVDTFKSQYADNIQLIKQMGKITQSIFLNYLKNLKQIQLFSQDSCLKYGNNQQQNLNYENNSHIILILTKNILMLNALKQKSLSSLKQLQTKADSQYFYGLKKLKQLKNRIQAIIIMNKLIKLNSIFYKRLDLLMTTNIKYFKNRYEKNVNVHFQPVIKEQYSIKLSENRRQSTHKQQLIHYNIVIEYFEALKEQLKDNYEQNCIHKYYNLNKKSILSILKCLQYLLEQINTKNFNCQQKYKISTKSKAKKQSSEDKQLILQHQEEVNVFLSKHNQDVQNSKWLTLDNQQVNYQAQDQVIDKQYLNQIISKINKKQNSSQGQNLKPSYSQKNTAQQQMQQPNQWQFLNKDKGFSFNLNKEISNQLSFVSKQKKQVQMLYFL